MQPRQITPIKRIACQCPNASFLCVSSVNQKTKKTEPYFLFFLLASYVPPFTGSGAPQKQPNQPVQPRPSISFVHTRKTSRRSPRIIICKAEKRKGALNANLLSGAEAQRAWNDGEFSSLIPWVKKKR